MTPALRDGVRALARRPLTSAVSVLCLAVGVGASAVAATLLDAVALRPLGLHEAGRLVVFWEADPSSRRQHVEVSLPDFEDWQRRARSVGLAAFGSSHWPTIGQAGGESFSMTRRAVSLSFFSVLGVTPASGRVFSPADLDAAEPPPVVLSHRVWRARLGGAPNAIGATLYLGGVAHRVIGVMPRGFTFPDAPDAWTLVERELERVFAAAALDEGSQRAIGVLEVLGRLHPHRSADDARAELTAITTALRLQHARPAPAGWRVLGARVTDLIVGPLGPRLWMAVAMAIVVLLFACANVAAVSMARIRERAAELVTRMCLGASAGRLQRALVLEATGLLLLTAAVSLACTAAGLAAVGVAPVVRDIVDLSQYRGTTLAAWAAALLLAWLLVAWLPPCLLVRRLNVEAMLASAPRIVSGSRAGRLLLAPQGALAMLLVAVAGGALQAFGRLTAIDVGFSTERVTAADVAVPGWRYSDPAARARVEGQVLRALEALPGVDTVAGVSVRPFRFGQIADGVVVRRSDAATTATADAPGAARLATTPRYFDVMGIRITEGRAFTDFDAGTRPVAVLSHSLARALFGPAPATGREVQIGQTDGWGASRLVVGVAEDVRSRVLEQPALEIHVPAGADAPAVSSFVMRTAGRTTLTDGIVRRAVQEVDREIAVERVQTMAAVVDRVTAPARILAAVATALALVAVVLLALGIFGATATAVRMAWGELAIRQSLGATPLRAVRAPLRTLAASLLAGLAAGIGAAPLAHAALARSGLAPGAEDLTPMAAGALAITLASAAAIWQALRRALRLSPADVLRQI